MVGGSGTLEAKAQVELAPKEVYCGSGDLTVDRKSLITCPDRRWRPFKRALRLRRAITSHFFSDQRLLHKARLLPASQRDLKGFFVSTNS
jgi:hypothetical protein